VNERVIESYPLTPMQQGILFNSLRARGGLVEIEQIVARLDHELDVPRLRAVWAWASDRHPVLRTSFRYDDGDPRQLVHEHAPMPFEQRDHSRLSEMAREEELGRFLEEDRELGFDLEKPPLARLTLFTHGPRSHVLVWTFHHVILDGRSFTQVLREVFERYDRVGVGDGSRPSNTPPPPSFRLHCEYLAQRDTTAEQAFWSEQLRGLHGPTPIPAASTSRERATRRRHDELEIAVGATPVARLIELGREHGFTLANAVQGAWAIVLARYSRTDDVCFGSTRAARHTSVPDATAMVGCLINTVPVRVSVPPEMEALELLRHLREINVATRPHEQASLVSMRGWAGIAPNTSLFETLVVFERYLMDTELRSLGGNWLRRQFTVLEQSDFPLVLAAYQNGEDLILKLEHDPIRCDTSAVARLLDHLATVLRAIAKNPLAQVRQLPLLSNDEHQELLRNAGGTGPLLPLIESTWPAAFSSRVHDTPNAIALVDASGEKATYAELESLSSVIMARLRLAHVSTGDIVAVCTERNAFLCASLVATLRLGAVYLPIDSAWPRERMAMILDDAEVRAVLAQGSTTPSLPPSVADRTIVLDEPNALDDRSPTESRPIDPESPAYLIYTSGSTGRPKGVLVPHRALLSHARAIIPAFSLTPSDRCLQFTSPSFDVSLEEMLPTWLAGSSVVLRSESASSSIDTFMQELVTHTITVVNVPSAFFTEIAFHLRDTKQAMPKSVRLVVVGGEKPSALAYATWRRLHPRVQFLNAYGPTEVTITSTYCDPVASGVIADGISELPIGRALGSCRAYVLDQNDHLAPVGVPGELCLAGPQVALGYLRRPELTSSRFVKDPFNPTTDSWMYRTGDLVRRLPNHDIEFCGRVDEQVKIRGYRIEPGEIESLLRSDSRVREVAVAARPSRSGSMRLLAWIVPQPTATLDESAVRKICANALPSYMVPSQFVFLSSLPLTPSGKVDKRALPEPDDKHAEGTFVEPEGDLQAWIASLYAELLGRDHISAEDHFFELGGHSLLALRLLSKINARAREPVQLGVIFANPTVSSLSRALETGGAGSLATLVALNRAPQGVPLFCICGVQLYARLARAMEADRPVFGAFLPSETEAFTSTSIALDVRSMASAYIALIREQRPEGPYLLGGVSFGGILAYEMAQQLVSEGETVALLALFDAILPRALHKANPLERARFHFQRFKEDPRSFGEHIRERMMRRFARVGGTSVLPGPDPGHITDVNMLRDELFRNAATKYDQTVRPYEGKVVLFRARDGLGHSGERVEWDLGWSGLIPESSAVHVVKGTHLGILNEPGVFEIARTLRAHLRGLDERPQMARTRRTSRISLGPPPPPSWLPPAGGGPGQAE
jgi:amino acid adenylation domain-containing protein